MDRTTPADQWPIYNCHIHTFTRQHTPKHFIKYVLSDRELGRISPRKIALSIFIFVLYIAVLFSLGNFILLYSASLDGVNLPIYAFLLLLEGLLTVPLVLLTFLVLALIVLLLAQAVIDAQLRKQPEEGRERWLDRKSSVHKWQERVAHPNILVDLLSWINPASSNDIFERLARFLKIAAHPSQEAIFTEIQQQYQMKETKTRFVVLPMDMTFMNLGDVKESIDEQHQQLLKLADKYGEQVIPFFAVDPRRKDEVVAQVQKHVVNGRFRGIKIYPNLGYAPNDNTLMKVYELCVRHDIPVMTHCSPGGVWQYGLSEKERREFSKPESYQCIFDEFRTLKLCLAHFGGAQEWARRLRPDLKKEKYSEPPWVRTIYEMIAECGEQYPNLYTDISYTAFTPKVSGLYIDLVDYLKVMLSHPRVRTRVLFGSDYYMVAQEKISEKEASILLRSRLGEDLYKRIAYTNPREYLGEMPAANTTE